MKTKLAYPLFFAAATVLFLPFVYLPLNALWLLFKSFVWFGAGNRREEYVDAVLRTTPLAGLSVVFLFLAVLLSFGLFVFSRTPRGRRFFAESAGITEWLAQNLFLGFTMLFELLFMLLGFTYRKQDRTRAPGKTDLRATQNAAIREYEFSERTPDDYAQFLRRLSRIRSQDGKIGYAYRTLCRLYKRAAPDISDSDTPREVQRKAERAGRFAPSELESIRVIIERVKFSGRRPDEAEQAEYLRELCRNVRILL